MGERARRTFDTGARDGRVDGAIGLGLARDVPEDGGPVVHAHAENAEEGTATRDARGGPHAHEHRLLVVSELGGVGPVNGAV